MHTRRERKSVGVPRSEEEPSKDVVSHLYEAVLLGLCLPSGQISGFFLHTYPRTLTWMHMLPSAKMDLEVKDFGRSNTHMTWHYPPTFDPQGAFLHMCSVSLVRKEGGVEIP